MEWFESAESAKARRDAEAFGGPWLLCGSLRLCELCVLAVVDCLLEICADYEVIHPSSSFCGK